MLLYHYSDILIKDKLTVDHYGANYFTANDYKVTTVKRLFFYDNPKPELLIRGSKYLYISSINRDKIYNITEDKKQYLKKHNGDIDLALRDIKKHYKGVLYNVGFNVINIFQDVKIKSHIDLTKR